MSNPFLVHQRLAREKTVQRYLTALEQRDFKAIDVVWQAAASDPALEQILFNLHQTFPDEKTLLAGLENERNNRKESTMFGQEPTPGKEIGSIHSLPPHQHDRPRHTSRWQWPVLVSVLAAILLIASMASVLLFIQHKNIQSHPSPKITATPSPTATALPARIPSIPLSPFCQVQLPAQYSTGTFVNDVLTLTKNDVWAVGSFQAETSQANPAPEQHALALHWDGQQWSSILLSSPVGSSLSKLTALTPNDIWSIGTTNVGNMTTGAAAGAQPGHTLIEHWDGSSWSQTPSPDLSVSRRNVLQSITALAANDVWVAGVASAQIGKSGYGSDASPLLEHWDGSTWQLVPLPAIQGAAGLDSIFALKKDDIWAGGSFVNGSSRVAFLIHWNGTAWKETTLHLVNSLESITSITVDAQQHFFALGRDLQFNSLLLSLNNGDWTAMQLPPTPDDTATSTFYNRFWALYVANAEDIWLVGQRVELVQLTRDSIATPLVEHWNGRNWQVVPEQYQVKGAIMLQTISASSSIWISGFINLYFGVPFIATACP